MRPGAGYGAAGYAIRWDDVDFARTLTRSIEWTYEPFLARTNFMEFSKYNIPL